MELEFNDFKRISIKLLEQNFTALKILGLSKVVKLRELTRIKKRLLDRAKELDIKIEQTGEYDYKIE